MIIKANQRDRVFLGEQLLKLIKENESYLSQASDEEIQSGIDTFHERLSVRRALLKRAIEEIQERISQRKAEKEKNDLSGLFDQMRWERAMEVEKDEEEIDLIGPDLLRCTHIIDDDIPF